MDIDVKNLHPLEVKLLRHVSKGEEITAERIIKELDYKVGQCNQAFSWLSAKECLLETGRTRRVLYELTDLGRDQEKSGMPVERIFTFIRDNGPHTMPEIAEALKLEKSDVGSAFGLLSKSGVTRLNGERKAEIAKDELPREVVVQSSLLKKAVEKGFLEEDQLSEEEKAAISQMAKKRGASSSPFKYVEREEITYALTDKGESVKEAVLEANITGEEFGVLTAEMLASGSWKNGSFRPYGINAPTSRLIPGRHNAYGDYLQWVKDKLTSLGFEEFDGPLVENEFWNGDALFMPQFHSARDIHDVYYVKDPVHCKEIQEPWLSRVAETHENGGNTGSRGWGYKFDHEFTRRQVLRSQGTV